jgi:uncharacterized protein (TIGR02646 family)
LKHIQKKAEPPTILQKITTPTPQNPQPTYSKLRSKKKQELRKILSEEQGFICCYCCQRIILEDSHIEHLQPQSTATHLSLSYENLLVSCQAELQAGDPIHCGKAKDNWFDQDLLVSPLQADCAEFFEYSLAGEILPTKDTNRSKAALETIDRLQLNISKLQAMRQAEITPLFELELSMEEVMWLIESFTTIDDQGYSQPFSPALIHLLKLEYSIDSTTNFPGNPIS